MSRNVVPVDFNSATLMLHCAATTSSSSAERSTASDKLLEGIDKATDMGVDEVLLESSVFSSCRSLLKLAFCRGFGFGGSARAEPVSNAKKSRSSFLKHMSVQSAINVS